MQQNGYRIIPVNPTETEVLGEKAYASEAITQGPRRLVQEGVIDQAAAQQALDTGLLVGLDRCLLKNARWLRSRLLEVCIQKQKGGS